MLSVQYIRENTARVKRDVVLRHTMAPIDRILQLDDERRALLQQVEGLRAKRNSASKAIGASRDSQEREVRITEMRLVGDEIDRLDGRLKAVQEELNAKLLEVPNIVDPRAPRGADEDANVELRREGERPHFEFEPKPHWDLGKALGGIDLEAGAKMAGSRFYVLRGGIARLYRSLIQWCLDEHEAAGYTDCYLPYMLTEASLYASGQLPKFRDNLYHDDEDDYYFIPTAEVAFVNLHRDEILPAASLPERLVSHTPCFRREKMSAGRDVRGIKRGHQFEKVELFVYCEPAESERIHEEMVEHVASLPRKLGIQYRVVELCTGDLGFNAARTFDIEMWSPGLGEWLEVSSISNVLDFQARRANIRYRPKAEAPPQHPHMLNGSGLGMVRTLIAVMENYQQADGSISVPAVLRPYMRMERITAPVG